MLDQTDSSQEMENVMQYDRWQSKGIQIGLKRRRVVYLAGPRQSGKSTLVQSFINDDVQYLNLDDEDVLEQVKFDLKAYVEHDKELLIIDEIQRVPELILAIKGAVDRDKRYGRFLVTGSANIHQIPTVRESLAGRITTVRMRPLSQGEIVGSEPKFLFDVLEQKFSKKEVSFTRENYIDTALRGGYPEAIGQSEHDRKIWAREYMSAILDRDMQNIVQIRRKNVLNSLIKTVASWSSQVINKDSLRSNMATNHSVSRTTMDTYLNILESMYLVDYVEPWSATDYGRIRKKPRIFLPDSGLTSALLNWKKATINDNHLALGKLFEMLVYSELRSQIEATDNVFELFHYRDREGREVDFIIEHEDGGLIGIEVKASTRAVKSDFKHLQWFKTNIAKKRPFVGILLYAGDKTGRFDEDMWSMPIEKLWAN